MAWKFLDSTRPQNKRYREEMMQSINAWWAHFQNKRKSIEAHLAGRADWDLDGFMAESLQEIDENLMWEFGTETSGGFQLIITPETERHLRPLVDEIIKMAPKIAGWSFYSYRQPHNTENTAELVADQTGVQLDKLSFSARADEENLIELTFKHADNKSAEALGDAVFMASEYLLGEEVLDRWVGDMLFDDGSNNDFKPMHELPNTVAALITDMQKGMADKPLAKTRDSLKVVPFTAEPEDDDESERFDMVSGKTRLPAIWEAAHGGSPFDSCRFSKHGEKFGYVKVEGLTDQAKLDKFENDLNAALVEADLGCTIGSAIGKRHGYVDVCMCDVDKAVAAMKKVASEAGLPDKSWLQFFDTDWAGEWVGLNPNAPTPPGMVTH